VGVPQPGDQRVDGEVELAVGHLHALAPQQGEGLDRVDGVAGPLLGQVAVDAAEHAGQGVHHLEPLAAVEGRAGVAGRRRRPRPPTADGGQGVGEPLATLGGHGLGGDGGRHLGSSLGYR
jgi:hypothetical protein